MLDGTRRDFVVHSVLLAALGPAAAGAVRRDDAAVFLRAVAAGEGERVRAMLDAAPGLLTCRDASGRSAFAVALLNERLEIAALLRAAGHAPDLHEAALALDWERFNALAEASPELVNAAHPIGGTAMTAAALGGAGMQMWRIYAQLGRPNPDRPATLPSPLRAAIAYSDLATAELSAATLLANGADPNGPEPGGDSALHTAARRGSLELVEMLVRKGARVDARNAGGDTPSGEAQRCGHAAVVALLDNHRRIPRDETDSRRAFDVHGARATAPDWGDLSLRRRNAFIGDAHRNLDAVREALRREPRLAHAVATTTEGAIEAAAHMGNHAIAEVLLEAGAPYSTPTAVMRGDVARVKTLLAEEPRRVHSRGAHDFALLWYPVIGGGHLEVAELLLAAGADVEQQHHLGTTALHWAAMRGQIDMAALFIEHGANVQRAGRKFGGTRATPLALADERGHDDVVRLLRDRGAKT